jgi:uncharacterized protein (DUF2235 family)
VGKNIVICCDGTGNQLAGNFTNVVKLYMLIARDTPEQVSYYHAGIGTLPFVSTRKNLLAQGLAVGIQSDILDVYTFLMKTYQSGDRLFLFGFSRGAFTVRAVASLLKIFGLFTPGHEHMIAYFLSMVATVPHDTKDSIDGMSGLSKLWRLMANPCKVDFVGVWDTVSSIHWLRERWALPYIVCNPIIGVGRHAISIDERRALFPPLLWSVPNPVSMEFSDIKQVWFPGVHSDVGGGYADNQRGISKITLLWMIKEAVQHGLVIDKNSLDTLEKSNEDAVTHESLHGAWKVAEFIPQRVYDIHSGKLTLRMNLFRRRMVPPGSLVHESAFEIPRKLENVPSDVIRYSG